MRVLLIATGLGLLALILVLARRIPESPMPLPSPGAAESAPARTLALTGSEVHPRARIDPPAPPAIVEPADEGLAPDGQPWSGTYDLMDGGVKTRTLRVTWDGGVKRMFHPNGQLYSETTYVDGKREGPAQAWHANGQLHCVDTWVSDRRMGVSTFYNDGGVMIARGAYKEGYRDGVWEKWFDDGTRGSVGAYSADSSKHAQPRTGPWTYWNPDGSIDEAKSGVYEGDKKLL